MAIYSSIFALFMMAGFVVGLIGLFGLSLYDDDMGLILIGLKLAAIGFCFLLGGGLGIGLSHLVRSSWKT